MQAIKESRHLSEPIQVVIITTIRAGHEQEFEQALHAFVQSAISFRGQLGVEIIRPAQGSGSRRYGVIHRFSDRRALDVFRTSAVLRDWRLLAAQMSEGAEDVKETHGLESWFTLGGDELRPIPQWKMAIATFIGVLPISLILGPILPAWNFLLRNLALNAVLVALLTWVVMPILTRVFRNWLYPPKRNARD